MKNWDKLKGKPALARIIADINSDGHLQIKNWRGLTSFYSNNKEEVLAHKNKMEKLFGIKGRIYAKKVKNVQYMVFFISKEIALFLNMIGVVEGRKSSKIFSVPSWIKNGNYKVKSAFLRGMYDCEGSIHPTKQRKGKPRWRISIDQAKDEKIKEYGKDYMEEIKKMVNELGIKTSPVRYLRKNPRKDGSYSISSGFDIEKNNFKNFYKAISFDNLKKKERLINVIKTL
ncbi:LAGLIDADG family homing endonuclease [Candidatus Woesearchaeota archaeon]|nr:LAGLIDADG family homing endonuclease [Candidatus Woesearchaeota archaeon]